MRNITPLRSVGSGQGRGDITKRCAMVHGVDFPKVPCGEHLTSPASW